MRIVVKTILTHEDQAILAYYPKDELTSFFGGGIESLEKSETALVRELKEEVNIGRKDIKSINFMGIAENFFLYEGEKCQHFVIYYHVDLNSKDNLKILEEGKHELRFIDINKLKEIKTKPHIESAVQNYFENKIIFNEIVNDDNIAR